MTISQLDQKYLILSEIKPKKYMLSIFSVFWNTFKEE